MTIHQTVDGIFAERTQWSKYQPLLEELHADGSISDEEMAELDLLNNEVYVKAMGLYDKAMEKAGRIKGGEAQALSDVSCKLNWEYYYKTIRKVNESIRKRLEELGVVSVEGES